MGDDTETTSAAPETWEAGLDPRTRKHVEYARHYAAHYAHGAPGHLDLMTIATLARMLDMIQAAAPLLPES